MKIAVEFPGLQEGVLECQKMRGKMMRTAQMTHHHHMWKPLRSWKLNSVQPRRAEHQTGVEQNSSCREGKTGQQERACMARRSNPSFFMADQREVTQVGECSVHEGGVRTESLALMNMLDSWTYTRQRCHCHADRQLTGLKRFANMVLLGFVCSYILYTYAKNIFIHVTIPPD